MANNNDLTIRKTSTIKLIFFSIITFGFYWYVWLWKLITDVNKLYPKKYIHRTPWMITLIGLELLSVYFDVKGIQKEFIVNGADLAWNFIQLLLALQILKNIEKYVKDKFDIVIKHNVLGWLAFGCFYINYMINRLPKSIQQAIDKKIIQLKLWK